MRDSPGQTTAPRLVKPKYRGIPDLVGLFLSIPSAVYLVSVTEPGPSRWASVIYGLSVVVLFAASSLYHVPMWTPDRRKIFRRIDHSAIYVLIAGSYTPICVVALPGQLGNWLLITVWSLALIGGLKTIFWPGISRGLNTALYVMMGWLILPCISVLYREAGGAVIGWLGLAGVLYTVGGITYARRWLNFCPTRFGYHESFHVFVIGASASIYAAIWTLVVP